MFSKKPDLPGVLHMERYLKGHSPTNGQAASGSPPAERSPLDAGSILRAGFKFSHLRMIVALEETGQVSAAASILNVSQPAASRIIAEMEQLLQVPLLERLPRGVQLTPFGLVLARRARTILLEMQEADREISDLRAGRGGAVFLGAVTAPAVDLVAPAVKIARAEFPLVEINLSVETSNFLVRELQASRLDFVIARIPDDLDPRQFQSRVIGMERASLVVRKGHPLLEQEGVGLEELNAYDWVFQPSGSLLRRNLERLFISRNVPLPDRVVNTTSLFLTLVMVAQTNAIAPLAEEVANFAQYLGGETANVRPLPLNFDIPLMPYSMITLRNRTMSPAARMLYDLILTQSAGASGG